MPRSAIVALVLAMLMLSTAGCGAETVTTTNGNGSTATRTVPNIQFARTKFALHAGLAFGAFHRYITKPYKAGAFHAGRPGHVRAIVKGGTAALFAVHELRTAREDALADDRLRPLAEKVEVLLRRLTHLGSELKRGGLDPSAIAEAEGAVSALRSASGGAGATIKLIAPSL